MKKKTVKMNNSIFSICIFWDASLKPVPILQLKIVVNFFDLSNTQLRLKTKSFIS